MSRIGEALYMGQVVHKRMRPKRHQLGYDVFAVLFDCDRLEALGRELRLFSYNRWNVISLFDRDHGDGRPLKTYLSDIAAQAVNGSKIDRFFMLCYPRVFGYVFNPLTVYFGVDAEDQTQLVIYEVNNTFGERQSYVLPVEHSDGQVIWQECQKRLHVSPFNTVSGRYAFHVTPIGDDLTVGVALKDGDGPLLKTFFRSRRSPLSDQSLIHALLKTGWMTVKVIAAIHFEAVRLWLKGIPVVRRSPAAGPSISFVTTSKEETS